jgi:hypothetical protein
MGAQLAREAYRYPKITCAQRMVLSVMALNARDTDEHPLYWGGWRPLAEALGMDGTPSQLRCIKRHVAELVRTGVLVRVGEAHRGQAQVYRLDLIRAEKGGSSGAEKGGFSQPPPDEVTTEEQLPTTQLSPTSSARLQSFSKKGFSVLKPSRDLVRNHKSEADGEARDGKPGVYAAVVDALHAAGWFGLRFDELQARVGCSADELHEVTRDLLRRGYYRVGAGDSWRTDGCYVDRDGRYVLRAVA